MLSRKSRRERKALQQVNEDRNYLKKKKQHEETIMRYRFSSSFKQHLNSLGKSLCVVVFWCYFFLLVIRYFLGEFPPIPNSVKF